MIIFEIEHYKGDCILRGKSVSEKELLEQIRFVERKYDRIEDNFVSLLCRVYGYERIDIDEDKVDYVYDRDVEKLFAKKKDLR